MGKSKRTLHVPEESLAELMTFLNKVGIESGDKRRDRSMERYVAGLLTDNPNKNCDTLAETLAGTNELRLQALLTTVDWDERDEDRGRWGVDHRPDRFPEARDELGRGCTAVFGQAG